MPAEIEVTISASSPSCGFEPAVGSRLGLLLDDAQPYRAGICQVISPEDLDRATSPPARPPGRGRIALLMAGRFGARTSVAALDRRGRVLAYGPGEGGPVLSVCPGGLPDLGTPTATRLGAGVVGVDTRGYLVGSTVGAAALRRIGLLPTADVRGLVAVPGAPALRGAGRAPPARARTATLNACSSPSPSRSAA